MESGHFLFDRSACHGNMLFLGNGDSVFRGARSVMNMDETSKRRPFFSSPEDLYDEEYYDEQLPEKKRRLTSEQVNMLEKSFEAENKLEPERKTQLAKKLGLQPRQVAVWFQNRRARWKTKQLERDYDLLKSSYDALLSNYESIVKENEKLKSEVISLTGEVQTKEGITALTAEAAETGTDPVPPEVADVPVPVPVPQLNTKIEDRLSTGSIGSAVVDEDGPQLVDSCNSYLQTNQFGGCLGPVDMMPSEEDDGSDDGRIYFTNMFVGAPDLSSEQHEEALGWWVWS